MSAYMANPLLDAATVLVGWTNRSATRDTEQLFDSGEVVRLNTKLDATLHFTLMVSHPGGEMAAWDSYPPLVSAAAGRAGHPELLRKLEVSGAVRTAPPCGAW